MEDLGIDPSASRMLSGRSTIWARLPGYWPPYLIVLNARLSYQYDQGYFKSSDSHKPSWVEFPLEHGHNFPFVDLIWEANKLHEGDTPVLINVQFWEVPVIVLFGGLDAFQLKVTQDQSLKLKSSNFSLASYISSVEYFLQFF